MQNKAHLSLCFFLCQLALIVGLVCPPFQAEAKAPNLGVAQLLLLKKLGYNEVQLRATVNKAKRAGKFQLQPMQVLSLRKAGFSIGFIRWLGITSPGKPRPAAVRAPEKARKKPAPRRPAFIYKLPWDRSVPATRRPSARRDSPSTRRPPRPAMRREPPPPRARPRIRPRAVPKRVDPTQPRPVEPTPVQRVPPRPPSPRIIRPTPQVLRLIQELRTGSSVQARQSAAHQLGLLGPKAMEAMPYLVMTLRLPKLLKFQPVYPLQQTAIWAIGRLGPVAARAVPHLLSVLRKPLFRVVATNALDRILLEVSKTHPQQLVRALRRMLQARWIEVKLLATRHLGYLGKAAAPALPALRAALRVQKPRTQAQMLRKYAAIALGGCGVAGRLAIVDLYRLYQDVAAGPAARRALARLLHPKSAHLQAFAEVLRAPGMQSPAKLDVLKHLYRLPPDLLQRFLPQLKALLQPTNNLALRDAATRTLSRLGPAALPALPALIQGLKIKKKTTTTTSFRRATANTLGAIGPAAKAAVPALLGTFGDFPEVLFATEQALRRIIKNPSNHWPVLVKALRQKQNNLLQIFAAEQLLRIRLDPSLQPVFLATLAKLVALERSSGVPAAYWSWGAYELAAQAAKRKQLKSAAKILSAAIAMGFDDHLVFATMPSWRTFLSSKEAKTLLSKMQSSPADQHELMWLKKETMSINHNTNMMIIEQMGRKDSGYTKVHQSRIPTRLTTSHAVQINRIFVHWLQLVQKARVLAADISRKNHLLNMQLISNMGTKKGLYARQRALMVRMQSLKMANSRAQARLRKIQQGQYKAPQNLSKQPSTVPLVPSITRVKTVAQAQFRSLIQRIEGLRKKKRWSAAEALVSRALKQQPKTSRLWYIRADIRTNRRDPQGALDDINNAIKLAPRQFVYRIQRSYIYYTLRKYQKSQKDPRVALRIAPQHRGAWVAYLNIAASLAQLGQHQRALLQIRRAYQRQPRHPLVLAYLSYIMLRLGHTKRATQWIKKALMYKKDDSFVRYVQATILAKNGRWGQAIEALRSAYDNGFLWKHMPHKEPAFAPLRKTPAFRSVTSKR